MPDANPKKVFLSYARKDGVRLARLLSEDLTRAGFDVWLDTERIRGGAIWSRDIERSIDESDALIALLTAGAYESEICRAEHLHALRKKKCVIPVLTGQGEE